MPFGVRGHFRLAIALLLTVCTTFAGTSESSEVSTKGWIFLERESTDTFLGTFHDKISGAFVELEIGMQGLLSQYAPTAASAHHAVLHKGENSGWQYSMVQVQQIGSKSVDQICTSREELKPTIFIASYSKDDPILHTWNLEAVVCSSLQQERISSFLLKDRQWWTAPEARGETPGAITKEQLNQIPVGTIWENVRRKIGSPFDSVPYKGGFLASFYYSIDEKPDYNRAVWFVFDQNRILQSFTIGKPGLPAYPKN